MGGYFSNLGVTGYAALCAFDSLQYFSRLSKLLMVIHLDILYHLVMLAPR